MRRIDSWGFAVHALLPWALPALAVVLLWSANRMPDLDNWRPEAIDQRDCGAGDSGWQPMLRYTYSGSTCRQFRVALRLDGREASDRAVLVTSVTRDAHVSANAQVLREADPSPAASYTATPILVKIPPELLHPGDNELLFELHSRAGYFEYLQIGRVFVGPRETLAAAWQHINRVGSRGAQLAISISLAICLFLLPIAWLRPHQSEYRWFALTVLACALYVLNFAVPWRPLPTVLWAVLVHAALALSLWSLIKFSHRFVGSVEARRERTFGWLVVVGVACFAVARWEDAHWLDWPAWLDRLELVYRAVQITLLIYLAAFWWRQRRRDTWPRPAWFAGGVALIGALGIYDSLTVLGAVGQSLTVYTLHWGAIYLLCLLFAALLMRIVRALGDAEQTQQRLAVALAERTGELETEFALRREAQAARTLAEERHRIMRDMHDGVGGQLVALIGQAQSLAPQELERQLRQTLDDLRLMIDSLDEACADLSVALGMLRQRLDAAFARLPLKIEWHTAHLPDLPVVSPTVVLNVMRIVQEAITNALKHAEASIIRVGANLADSRLVLTIADDGRGLRPDAPHGRGVDSMRERARTIGATLELRSGAGGTEVVLGIPMAPRAA